MLYENFFAKRCIDCNKRKKGCTKLYRRTGCQEDILKILNAAMAAPATINMLPWKLIVISEAQKIKTLANGLPFAKMLVRAGTGIVVIAVPNEAARGSEEFAIIDCTCASENIL